MNILTVKDIWDLRFTHTIAITTNLGWKANGENVMGAGIAKEAASLYPNLPKLYGQWCRSLKKDDSSVCILTPSESVSFIMFPTKELNKTAPWLSWKSDSTLGRVERSCIELVKLISQNKITNRVALPPPGCGNGNLSIKDVLPILDKHLNDLPVDLIFRNKK